MELTATLSSLLSLLFLPLLRLSLHYRMYKAHIYETKQTRVTISLIACNATTSIVRYSGEHGEIVVVINCCFRDCGRNKSTVMVY